MQIITLNDREAATLTARDYFTEVVGLSKAEAVELALAEHVGKPSRKFVEWLSDGAFTMTDGSVSPAA